MTGYPDTTEKKDKDKAITKLCSNLDNLIVVIVKLVEEYIEKKKDK